MQGLFGPPSGDIGGLDYERKQHLRIFATLPLRPLSISPWLHGRAANLFATSPKGRRKRQKEEDLYR